MSAPSPTVIVPESFLESHSWTTKLRGCFCGDLTVLPDEDPAYFDAFADIAAFRKAMRDQSTPKSYGARVYLTHRFIVHKLRQLTSAQFPTRGAFSDAQSQASQGIAELMGDVSFMVDSDNPGVFASIYAENFVKSFSSALPVLTKKVINILELDRLVAEDDDINNALRYSPPQSPQQKPHPQLQSEQSIDTEQKAPAGRPKPKSSADLLLAMKQNPKSVGQFSKALRDPELAFRQISFSVQNKKQQEAPKPVAKECVNEKQCIKPQAMKRKRRW